MNPMVKDLFFSQVAPSIWLLVDVYEIDIPGIDPGDITVKFPKMKSTAERISAERRCND